MASDRSSQLMLDIAEPKFFILDLMKVTDPEYADGKPEAGTIAIGNSAKKIILYINDSGGAETIDSA